MRKAAFLLLLIGCTTPPKTSKEDLPPRLEASLSPAGGEWGIYFRDLQDGETLEMRADEEFHPASTLKIFVMIKVLLDVHNGLYSLSDDIDVADTFLSAARKDPREFKVEAATATMAGAIGKRMAVRAILEHMITESDNLATNNLIRQAGGPREINAMLHRLGVHRSNVARFIMDEQAFNEGMSSVAVPREFGQVLEKIWRLQVVSAPASKAMLEVMSRLKDNSMIPGRLPAGTKVSHKTGDIDGVRNDVGVVTLPDGRAYVAVFYSRKLADDKKAESCIAGASRLLYDHVLSKR